VRVLNDNSRDPDDERSAGSADDQYAACEPDGDSRADGDVHSSGRRHSAAKLPVEEERHNNLWGDLRKLYHASDDEFRQRGTVHGGGQQHGRSEVGRVGETSVTRRTEM